MLFKANTTVASNGKLRNKQYLVDAKDRDAAMKALQATMAKNHGKAYEINSLVPFGQAE